MTSSMENPVSLGSTSTSRGQMSCSFPAFHPTTYLHSGANGAEFGSLNCVDGDPFSVSSCYKGKIWRNRGLRATGKNANAGEDADDESCDLSKIEQGKEILAQQKNLIQQVYNCFPLSFFLSFLGPFRFFDENYLRLKSWF